LNTALSPRTLAQQFTMLLLWEVDLSLHTCSQPLCLAPPLLADNSALLRGGLLPHPCSQPLFLVLLSFAKSSFADYSLPHTHSLRLVQCSIKPPLQVVGYNSLVMLFSFVQGGFNLPSGCAGLWGRRVTCGACCSPVGSADLCRQL
jgi:hypothetical protein